MNIQPVFPLIVLIPVCLLFLALGVWLCLRSLRKAPKGVAPLVLGLRVLVLLILAIILLNPGSWKAEESEDKAEWIVMLDTSASMDVLEGDEKRVQRALERAKEIVAHGEKAGVPIKLLPYDSRLKAEVDRLEAIKANGNASLLETAGSELLQQYSSSGNRLGGVIVLSDGRQTSDAIDESFFLKAKASSTSFHTYTIGQDYPTADIEVASPYKMVSAFAGQNIQITAAVQIRHSDKKFADVELVDEAGEVMDTVKLDLSKGSTTHSFSITAPEESSVYTIRTAKIDKEIKFSNNQTKVNVRILKSKTKVFLAEGAPYWDSKFLAQLLRQQKHMDVTAVYRLSSTRWFMISSESAKPFETDKQIFPDSVEKLAEYDLIVLGKNIDGFLTPEIANNLRRYVREHGGAVLFSRGKSFTSNWPNLAALEPVGWKNDQIKEFKMSPTKEGELIGLFGQALPHKDSSIWGELPPLKDAYAVNSVKPFSRVLAEGSGSSGKFPLLVVRRYGQGVSAMINADGLWKWDFFPEVKSKGNMYNEFWSQLIQWMVSYSEFLPGYDHSLHLSSGTVKSGEVVAVRVGYRGKSIPEKLSLLVESEHLTEPMKLVPARSIAQDGRVEWRTTVKYEKPGVYRFKLVTDSETPLPETSLTINAPPSEFDELGADPEYMEILATQTGGKVITKDSIKAFLNTNVIKEKASIENGRIKWHSLWEHWAVAIVIVLLMGSEWWIRRRNGLL